MLASSLSGRLLLTGASLATPFRSWVEHKAMLETDWMEEKQRASLVMEQLRAILDHAIQQTELYKQLFASSEPGPRELHGLEDWARLPITTKDDLRRGFPGPQLARSHQGRLLRFSNTSGTTGRPLLLIQDVEDLSKKYASKLWSRALGGTDPLGRVTRLTPNECQPCSPDEPLPPGARAAHLRLFHALEHGLIHPVLHGRTRLAPFWTHGREPTPAELDACLREIDRSRPVILVLYPLYALLLARHLRRGGQRPPRVQGVVDFSGGLCTPWMRREIQAAFGTRTIQCCGGCEFGRYGASCPEDPDHMHLAETQVYLELLRADGATCAPGELGNSIVTSLHSRAMPVIRLEPGDVARVLEGPCSCGRSSRRLQHEGRVHGIVRSPDGRWVTERDLYEAFLPVPGLSLFQLVQETPTRFLLKVVPQEGRPLDQDALSHEIKRSLGAGAQVRQERVPTIPPEPSGKLRLVKSCTYEDFRVASARRTGVPVN